MENIFLLFIQCTIFDQKRTNTGAHILICLDSMHFSWYLLCLCWPVSNQIINKCLAGWSYWKSVFMNSQIWYESISTDVSLLYASIALMVQFVANKHGRRWQKIKIDLFGFSKFKTAPNGNEHWSKVFRHRSILLNAQCSLSSFDRTIDTRFVSINNSVLLKFGSDWIYLIAIWIFCARWTGHCRLGNLFSKWFDYLNFFYSFVWQNQILVGFVQISSKVLIHLCPCMILWSLGLTVGSRSIDW